MINNRQGGRRRGRGGQGSGRNLGGQPGNRQDNRQRGNAAQLLEKYKSMARDAQLAGDRVQTEYYLQFADHYFRVLGESRSRFEDQGPRRQRDDDSDDDQGDDEMAEAEAEASADEPEERDERFNRPSRPRSAAIATTAAIVTIAAIAKPARNRNRPTSTVGRPSRSTCSRRRSAATNRPPTKRPRKSRAVRAAAPALPAPPTATTRSRRRPDQAWLSTARGRWFASSATNVNNPSVTLTSVCPRSRSATTSIRTPIDVRPTRSISA